MLLETEAELKYAQDDKTGGSGCLPNETIATTNRTYSAMLYLVAMNLRHARYRK
jgi:hypothetical protein